MSDEDRLENAIAIIGIAGHFPGARNTREFWQKLAGEEECLTEFSPEELRAAGVPDAVTRDEKYVPVAPVLDEMEWFDAGFFGLSPRDAAIMDPQHRHFLECCWEALEDAGHVPSRFEGAIGVFAGSGTNAYFWQNVMTNQDLVEDVGFFLLRHTGNDKDFLSTRVSYAFDLKGPSVNVQTACSTSLVAVHYAAQSLLAGECDMALAGGSTIEQPHGVGYLYKEGEILSPDGHCRPFDAESAGTLFGSGAGAVLLKRYTDAVADGDHIYAMVLGSAINNDGAGKVGYLAPSVDGQAQAISEALSIAEVPPDTVSYVEAHGTGTRIGDPIEVAALSKAFKRPADQNAFCGLGSVKSNIGHLDTAAGIAGLIKVVLSMENELLPATLNFSAPNPSADFSGSPFYVVSEAKPWPRTAERPRRAGVSSLGVGGTNAHVILEEAPAVTPAGTLGGADAAGWRLVPLSAKSRPALETAGVRLAEHLESAPHLSMGDVAHTLSVGREGFGHRRAVIARSAEDVVDALGTRKSEYAVDGEAKSDLECVFMFAGGGAQYPGMARDLYDSEPTFRAALDECLKIGTAASGEDLEKLLYPAAADHEGAAAALRRPSVALPILFSVQYAMTLLLQARGVRPSAMIGHSMGEYTAACLSGVLTVEGALKIVSLRGKLFEELDPGGMVSVSASEESIRTLLPTELSVAAVNAPEMCVVAGPVEPLARFEQQLVDEGFETRRVQIDVAAHSKMLEPILDPFRQGLQGVAFGEPSIPFVSNLSGKWVGAEAADPDYWVRHLRETVRFSEGLSRIAVDLDAALVEVGPGRTLATLAKASPDVDGDRTIVTTVRHPNDELGDIPFALRALATLWASGVPVALDSLSHSDARRVSLPTYPFEKAKHWITPGRGLALSTESPEEVSDSAPDGEGVRPLEDWFSVPSWTKDPGSTDESTDKSSLGDAAVIVAGPALGAQAKGALEALGVKCHLIPTGPDEPVANRMSDEDWAAHFRLALADTETSLAVFYLAPQLPAGAPLETTEWASFYGVMHLLRGLELAGPQIPVHLVIGAPGLAGMGDRAVDPGVHLVLGPARVGPREFPGLSCRVVDSEGTDAEQIRHLLAEAEALAALDDADRPTDCVAYLEGQRYLRTFSPLRLADQADWSVEPEKTYVITGGFGGLGLTLAGDLAAAVPGVTLALLGRRPFPERWEWSEIIGGGDRRLAAQVSAIERMEADGATVQLLSVDLTDSDALASALEDIGPIHGVFHAAGALDDAPILAKEDSEWASVLGPKVTGTQLLWRALDGHPLDFMICFSSRSAVTGLAGQADYAAANAFLDGFAARWDRPDRRIISVGWDAWAQVGMAHRLFGGEDFDSEEGEPRWESVDHPIFDERSTEQGRLLLRGVFGEEGRHWMLDDHRIKDGPRLIPGSGYVEIVRSAAEMYLGTPSVELSELMFLEPFVVRDGARREIVVEITPAGADGLAKLEIRGRDVENGAPPLVHVRGAVSQAGLKEPNKVRLKALRKQCKKGRRAVDHSPAHAHLDFGPRWANLVEVNWGTSQAFARLELPGDLHGDLDAFPLHPGMLDMATAAGLDGLTDFDPARDFYVPTSYGSVRIGDGFHGAVFSHVSVKEGSGDGVAILDVRIYGEDGQPLVEIDEFVMMRIESFDLGDALSPAPPNREEDVPDWRRFAIPSALGMDALRRVMAHAPSSRVLVTPRSIDRLIEEAGELSRAAIPQRRRPPPRLDYAAVESGLETHEGVAEAAVIATWVGPDEYRIIAFVRFAEASHATVSEMRRHLKALLSPELIPHSYIETTDFPRLTDGRVDRKSLPNPFDDADEYVAPRTPTEQAIARIWEDLLGVERVSLHDNFLDVGGHSLIGIRTLIRIEKETGYRLHPNALTLQTLEQLAAECDQGAQGSDDSPSTESEGLAGRLLGAVRQSVGRGS